MRMKKFLLALLALALILAPRTGGLAEPTEEAASAGAAEGYDELGGAWRAGGVINDGRIFDIHDVDALESMFDTYFLSFSEDGTFLFYQTYFYTGHYAPYKDDIYLLRIESLYRLVIEDGEGRREEIEFDPQSYAVEFCDADTLVLGRFDPMSGKIAAGDIPLLYVREGCESQYIAEHKVQVADEEAEERASAAATLGERNALKTAQQYLSVMPFSYEGLIDQLEYEGFTHSEAVYGADNCGADWNEQAAMMAESYLDILPFSRSELIGQLEFEGFTHAQAVYGAEQNGY